MNLLGHSVLMLLQLAILSGAVVRSRSLDDALSRRLV